MLPIKSLYSLFVKLIWTSYLFTLKHGSEDHSSVCVYMSECLQVSLSRCLYLFCFFNWSKDVMFKAKSVFWSYIYKYVYRKESVGGLVEWRMTWSFCLTLILARLTRWWPSHATISSVWGRAMSEETTVKMIMLLFFKKTLKCTLTFWLSLYLIKVLSSLWKNVGSALSRGAEAAAWISGKMKASKEDAAV